MKKLLVYVDSGVGSRAQIVVPRTFLNEFAPLGWTLEIVTASEIIAGALSSCLALVVPGGADTPYCENLHGRGCNLIKSFVANGGVYVGLCAGAYFAASSIEWNKGQPDEIIAKRELEFFQGVAIGPVSGAGTYDPYSDAGARLVKLTDQQGKDYYSYFNGGCKFIGHSPDSSVIFRYSDTPQQSAAVVQTKYQKGTVILSGAHPEYSGYDLEKDHPLRKKLIALESQRTELFRKIMRPLLEIE